MNNALKVKLLNRLSETIRKLEIEVELEAQQKRKKKIFRAYVCSNVERKWYGKEAITINIGRFG